MAVLDGAIANVALPVIAHELGASPSMSVWVDQRLSADDHDPASSAGGARRPDWVQDASTSRGWRCSRWDRWGCAAGGRSRSSSPRGCFRAWGGMHHEHERGAGTERPIRQTCSGAGSGTMRWCCRSPTAVGSDAGRADPRVASWQWLFLIKRALRDGAAADRRQRKGASESRRGTGGRSTGRRRCQRGDDGPSSSSARRPSRGESEALGWRWSRSGSRACG